MNYDWTLIKNLSTIENKYSLFLIDLWGVIHNGFRIFPEVKNVLKNLKNKNKKIFFITNAPRRASMISSQLLEFGIEESLYDKVISSGEITWYSLNKKIREKKRKIRLYHIGPPRDDHLIYGLQYELVDKINEADILLNTGPWGDNDKLDNYIEILKESKKYSLLMICSNPDKRVIRGNNFMICAGALADYYEEIGGPVEYYGKPYPEIYNYCFQNLDKFDRKKILVIGDSLENDIKGANNQKCDSLLIVNGIHREVVEAETMDVNSKRLKNLMKLNDASPTFISLKLNW